MKLLLTVTGILMSVLVNAQLQHAENIWYNGEKTSKIQIFKTGNNTYSGKIVWLKDPTDNGKPKTDKENPKQEMKNVPLLNLVILKGFKPSADEPDVLEGGTIYDPKSGKTYCGKITVSRNALKLRGHICGWSWLGRSTTWELAEEAK